MVQGSSLINTKKVLLFAVFLAAGVMLLEGCQKAKQPLTPQPSLQDKAISRLEMRINKLESQIKATKTTSSQKDINTPTGPIKSITFRIGTKDDRLRVYWADGSNSDLPCTKEQSIWACG